MRQLAIGVLVVLGLMSTALAGDSVSIRLVRATPGESAAAAGLEDVIGTLQKNLGPNAYSLVASTVIKLPARRQDAPVGDFRITCSGSQQDFTFTVNHKRKAIINTTVELRDGKPLVIGGIPGKQGTFILVFVAR